jgi:heat shock protein HtpX
MWAISKRIFLFLLTNILVMATISIVFTLVSSYFGIPSEGWLPMIILYSMFGFGGAFFSLFTSKWMAKRMMGVQVIDPNTNNPTERKVLTMVYNNAQRAKLPKMPEVGIFDSPEVNAFATGPSKSNSLVAVSTGLLNKMDEEAVDGVIGHEVAHIANGDMVTMTLLQGLMNTLVLIFARLIANLISSQMEERSRGVAQFIIFQVLQIALSLLGAIVVNYFSRQREFRADAGGARYAGRERMLKGLRQLRSEYGHVDDEQQALATLKISGHFGKLFSTHPPLEERIKRLETLAL